MRADEGRDSATVVVAKEVLELAKKLWDARGVARSRVFAEKIEPLMEAIQENHRHFIHVIEKLTETARRMDRNLAQGRNDLREEVLASIEKIEELYQKRADGRDGRRRLVADAAVFREELQKEGVKKKVLFTPDEISLMSEFYERILEYFSRIEGRYAHDLGHKILLADQVITRVADRDIEKSRQDLAVLLQNLKEYADDRETRWIEICGAYARIPK